MERVVLTRLGLAAIPTCTEPPEPERVDPPKPREVAAPTVVRPAPVERRTICTDQRVAWVEFVVPARKADGRSWDARGGVPDLRYTIYIEGQKLYESPVHETLEWRHQPQAEVRVAPQQQLSIQLLDSDQQSSETIAVFRSIIPADTSEALDVSAGAATARIKLECIEG
ncbi:hypothetical protein ENSA7_07410 [Enhygromyxa salina]|uniref:Uncharacterized protein n=2 Tax=Enhygromyxa salina TaxID=215803 RepID=A0A2S9YWR9_9BACT|nr:hypothetical protein ENSA7_07410 [Enhygromyxa salina]